MPYIIIMPAYFFHMREPVLLEPLLQVAGLKTRAQGSTIGWQVLFPPPMDGHLYLAIAVLMRLGAALQVVATVTPSAA